nr:HU family DNA-binding protein [Nocardioides sp. zg-DK7169]
MPVGRCGRPRECLPCRAERRYRTRRRDHAARPGAGPTGGPSSKGKPVNKTQLIDALAAHFEGNRRAAAHALDSVLDTITREVAKGEKVAITGFGSFEKRVREGRWVRNPQTGDRVHTQTREVPAFRPGADLKNVVSGAKMLPQLTIAVATAPMKAAASAARKAAAGAAPARPAAAGAAAKKSTTTTKAAASKTTPAKAAGSGTANGSATTSSAKKAASGSTAKKSSATKASAKKTTSKATAPSAAKKTTAKKTTAKKTTAKKSSGSSTAKKSTSSTAKKTASGS